jgi:hypothetical protein
MLGPGSDVMARKLQVSLIGCVRHKLNLAVRMWIQKDEQLVAIILKVSCIMKKTNTLKLAAKVCSLTPYSCVRENVTRWSSTYQMISRLLKIQAQLSFILVELPPMLPTHSKIDALTKAHASLKKFDGVTLMLQKVDITFI